MAEIRTVTTLESKKLEVRNAIAHYERLIKQARADLAHITACIRLFELSDEPSQIPAYADVHRLFKHRELGQLCHQALAQHGTMDTRELAAFAMQAKGLDAGDKALAKAIAYRVVMALRMQHKRGKIADGGKRKGVRLWALPQTAS